MKELRKLVGDIPLLYHRETIYYMCIVINQLVDTVNKLSKELEDLKNKEEENGLN